jgi:hypothetical protein
MFTPTATGYHDLSERRAQPDTVKGNVSVPSARMTSGTWRIPPVSTPPTHHDDHIATNVIEDVIVQRALRHR